jgi:hypothetical protein
MKLLWTVLLCILILATNSPSEGRDAEKAAIESANHWLSLVDGGDYAGSWHNSAPQFKGAVSKDRWVKMLQASRAPLGKLISRSIRSASYKTSLPGAPDGQYVVIQYQSSFEHKKSAIESVTPSLGDDGQWRVSGYFIR